MTIGQAVVLGIIQGLTEFLPVSSSAHLYVIPTLLGWKYMGPAFDVALHWGTLFALLLVFGGEWWFLFRDALAGTPTTRSRAWGVLIRIAVATVPAAAVGLLLAGPAEDAVRNLPLQATMLVVFGFLLWWVDRVAPERESSDTPRWRTSLTVGAAQALALIPGVSRSGITITAGRACGMKRVAAARFSFLLATPITFGAGVLEFGHMRDGGVAVGALVAGIVSAAVVGVFAIRGLLAFLNRAGLFGFFVYRLALAAWIVVILLRHKL
jgi:undecaprenyl-diphosphatase